MSRRPETWVSLYNLMMKHRGISRSSAILGWDSPQSNNRKDNSLWVTPFIPRERPNVQHAIAGYLRLLVECRKEGTLWQAARRLWQDTRRLQLPLGDCYSHSMQQTEQIPVTHPGWVRKVSLLAIIPVPFKHSIASCLSLPQPTSLMVISVTLQ